MGFVITFLCAAGLGGLMPFFRLPDGGKDRLAGQSPWIGFRLLLGVAAIPLLLFILNPLLGIALRPAAMTVAGIAAVGWGARLWGLRRRRAEAAVLVHPVVVFAGLLVGLAAVRGGLSYLPVAGDELTGWLYTARLQFTAGSWWTPDMAYRLVGYPPGWPLFMAFPALLLGTFDEGLVAPLPFLLHIGLLGALYDLLPAVLGLEGLARPAARRTVAWAVVLGLLAVEAAWRLFPTNLLIERPQIYAITGLFLGGMAGLLPGARRGAIGLGMGLLLAVGYLFKAAMGTVVPAMAVFFLAFLLADRREVASPGRGFLPRRAALLFAGMGLPFLAVYGAWLVVMAGIGMTGGCFASYTAFLASIFDTARVDAVGATLLRYAAGLANYLIHFKAPLSFLALIGFAASLREARGRWLALAFAGFAGAYLLSLGLAYAGCFHGYESATLASLQRYTRVVLRPFHFVGLVLLAAAAWRGLRGRLVLPCDRLHPLAAMGLVLAVAGLFARQGLALHGDIESIATRSNEDPEWVGRVVAMRAEARALNRLLAARGLADQSTRLLYAGMGELEWGVARYYSVVGVPGGPLYRYRLEGGWRMAPVKQDLWTTVMTAAEARTALAGEDVIWPVKVDAWMTGLLGGLVDDVACRADPARYFLLRVAEHPGRFDCVAKDEAAKATIGH